MSPAPLRVWRESWLTIVLHAGIGATLIWLALRVYEPEWWRQLLGLIVGYVGVRVTWSLAKDLWCALLPRAAFERYKARGAARLEERLAPFAEPGDFDLWLLASSSKKRFDVATEIRYVTGETSGRTALDLAETSGSVLLRGRSEASCEAAAVLLQRAGATVEIRRREERGDFSSTGDEKSPR